MPAKKRALGQILMPPYYPPSVRTPATFPTGVAGDAPVPVRTQGAQPPPAVPGLSKTAGLGAFLMGTAQGLTRPRGFGESGVHQALGALSQGYNGVGMIQAMQAQAAREQWEAEQRMREKEEEMQLKREELGLRRDESKARIEGAKEERADTRDWRNKQLSAEERKMLLTADNWKNQLELDGRKVTQAEKMHLERLAAEKENLTAQLNARAGEGAADRADKDKDRALRERLTQIEIEAMAPLRKAQVAGAYANAAADKSRAGLTAAQTEQTKTETSRLAAGATPSGRTDPAWNSAFKSIYDPVAVSILPPEKQEEIRQKAILHADSVVPGAQVASRQPPASAKTISPANVEKFAKEHKMTPEQAREYWTKTMKYEIR